MIQRVLKSLIPIVVCLSQTSYGQAMPVPPQQAIPLFLKILTYDETLTESSFRLVTFYALHDRATTESFRQFSEAEAFFAANPNLLVSGRAVRFVPLPAASADSVLKEVDASAYNVLLNLGLPGKSVRALLTPFDGRQIRTFSLNPGDVPGAVAVSVQVEGEQPTILVALERSATEGSQFRSSFLSICRVFR